MAIDPQIKTLLSECKLHATKDFAFGDAEYIWVDSSDMIVAEAYISMNTATFWTCPPGSWIISSKDPIAWQHGSDYNEEDVVRYDGEQARECSRIYQSISLYRNDNPGEY